MAFAVHREIRSSNLGAHNDNVCKTIETAKAGNSAIIFGDTPASADRLESNLGTFRFCVHAEQI